MAIVDSAELERAVRALKEKRGDDQALAEIASLAEATGRTLHAFLQSLDHAVIGELKAIAAYIDTLHKEIGAMQPNDMHRTRIPSAGQELDAIIKETERASNTILACAEDVMAANASDPERYKAFVQERMLTVFETCSFQDLIGQRIAKVVKTLKHIESRVARFAAATRVEDLHDSDTGMEDIGRALSHGPARPGEGNSQEAIDEIFGSDTASAGPESEG